MQKLNSIPSKIKIMQIILSERFICTVTDEKRGNKQTILPEVRKIYEAVIYYDINTFLCS